MNTLSSLWSGLTGSRGTQPAAVPIKKENSEATVAKSPAAPLATTSVVVAEPGRGSPRVSQSSSSSSTSSTVTVSSVAVAEREVQTPTAKIPALVEKAEPPTKSHFESVLSLSGTSNVLTEPGTELAQATPSSSSSTSISAPVLSTAASSSTSPGGEIVEPTASKPVQAQGTKETPSTDQTESRRDKAMLLLKEMHEPSFSAQKFFAKNGYDSLKSYHSFKNYFESLVKCNTKKIKGGSIIMDACCSFAYGLLSMNNQRLKETRNVKEYFEEADYTRSSKFSDLYDPNPCTNRVGFTFEQVFGVITSVVLCQLVKIAKKNESLEVFLAGFQINVNLLCVPLLHNLLLINDRDLLDGVYEVLDGLYEVREELQITHFERIKNFILSILEGEDVERIRTISDRMTKSWNLGELEVCKEEKTRKQSKKIE